MSFLAIDLGASSGRAILGTIQNEQLEFKEISRFSNPIIEINGRLYWDLYYLYNQIIGALQEVKSHRLRVTSLGIDTWGVDGAATDRVLHEHYTEVAATGGWTIFRSEGS